MKAKLTKEQLLRLAANAVNASIPVGMGILHFENKNYDSNDIESYGCLNMQGGGLYIDYFHGRMVKLNVIEAEGDNIYYLPDSEPDSEYQSWCRVYLTYKALVESVGREVL